MKGLAQKGEGFNTEWKDPNQKMKELNPKWMHSMYNDKIEMKNISIKMKKFQIKR